MGAPWRLWGPYLAGRQWGTVREDYSEDGDAWGFFPFEHARARAYRWGEDGLGGISDRYGFLNFSVALWNGRDPILKERLFGLTNEEGNHGEDAKEYWWAVDGTPTHSWMQWLYRYPQAEFPYERLRAENAARSRLEREYELADTGVLDEDRFFDVQVTYAKASPEDVCIVVTATNHGPDPAPLHLLPQVWFRNTWSWGRDKRQGTLTPAARAHADGDRAGGGRGRARLPGPVHARRRGQPRRPRAATTRPTPSPCSAPRGTRPGIRRTGSTAASSHGDQSARQPVERGHQGRRSGTAGRRWRRGRRSASGCGCAARTRTTTCSAPGFDEVLATRRSEADDFYASVIHPGMSDDDRHVARRAYAGLLWTKQLYRFDVAQWLDGDPDTPAPASRRSAGRGATPAGGTWRWPTSSRCPTSGSTRGSRRGTPPSTRSRWRTSTRRSPRSSWS